MSTDPTPETARTLLYRHGLPEDVIDGALCLHAQELAAVQREAHDELRPFSHMGLPCKPEYDCGVRMVIDLIDPTRTAPAAGCVVSAAPTQTDLRQRIAAVLRPHASLGGTPPRYELPYFDGSTPGLPRIAGWKPLDEVVDALAVLPPPADRGAVLLETEDDEGDELVCVDMCGSCDACGMEPFGTPAEGWREAARFLRRTARGSGDRKGALHGAQMIENELRRVAVEAQPQPDTETRAADPDCERCEGSGLDPDAYFVEGDVWTHAPCSECLPEDDDEQEPTAERVKHSGPDTEFCVLCLSGEHERVDDGQAAVSGPRAADNKQDEEPS